jgi:hypothetical protein
MYSWDEFSSKVTDGQPASERVTYRDGPFFVEECLVRDAQNLIIGRLLIKTFISPGIEVGTIGPTRLSLYEFKENTIAVENRAPDDMASAPVEQVTSTQDESVEDQPMEVGHNQFLKWVLSWLSGTSDLI